MFRVLVALFCCSIQLLFASPKVLIGIAGGTGSRKTTFAHKILKSFPSNSILISQDSYYKDLSHLPYEERGKTNFDHPNSLDFALLREQLIDLKNGRAIDQPIYNFHIHNRESATKRTASAEIIIVEGILLFAAPEVRDLFDVKVFIDTNDDVRVLRRIERDVKERSRQFADIKEQYLATVKPMHDAFVEPSKRFADVIILGDSHNQIALSLILSKLNEELSKTSK